MSRPSINGVAMTSAERQRRHRAKRLNGGLTAQTTNGETSATLPASMQPNRPTWQHLLSLDAESLASLIVAGCSPEKADMVAKSINARC